MLKVWGRSNSINVQKVMWVIGELGLECDRVDVGGAHGRGLRRAHGATEVTHEIPIRYEVDERA